MPTVKTVSTDIAPLQYERRAPSLERVKANMLAAQLMGKAATEMGPVYSPIHGIAKLGAGALAGFGEAKALRDHEASLAETRTMMADALERMGKEGAEDVEGGGGIGGLDRRSLAGVLADPNVPEALKVAMVTRALAKPEPKWGPLVEREDGSAYQTGPRGEIKMVREARKPEEDVTLGPGQARYRGGQEIARNPAEPKLLTPEELAQQKELRSAGRAETNVNIDQKADSKFAQTMAEGLGKTFNKMIDDGMSAQADLSLVDQMEELQKRVPTGGGAAMKAALGSWGIRSEGLSDIEAYQSVINRLIPKQRDGLPGSTSDKDLALLAGAVPRLINTPEGNAIIMNTMRSGIENRIARGDIATRLAMGTINDKQAMAELKSLPNPLARFLAYEQERLKATSPAPGAPSAAAAPNAQGTTTLAPRPTPQQALEILRQREMQRQQQQQGVAAP